MKKKLCLSDVLSCVRDAVDVSVLYADDEEYSVPKDGDWRSMIPDRVQRMSVMGIGSLSGRRIYVVVGTYEEVRG